MVILMQLKVFHFLLPCILNIVAIVEVGVSFFKESTFADIGDTCILAELVLETQAIGNTTFDFEEANNKTTIEKPNELLEVVELVVHRFGMLH